MRRSSTGTGLCRDYLIKHPRVAGDYEQLKLRLSRRYEHDRLEYTQAKKEFVTRITRIKTYTKAT